MKNCDLINSDIISKFTKSPKVWQAVANAESKDSREGLGCEFEGG